MSKAKILIVEDEGVTALNIKAFLENWGYEDPLIALSGKDILQVVAQYSPDLILMDINLNEDLDGIEIARQLQTDFDVPVLYLTAHCDEEIMERTKLTAHYGYIIKPFNGNELKIMVDQAIYRHKLEKELKKTNKRLQSELEEREKIERKLKKSEKKFKGIVKQSYDGIALVDENGYIIEWNHGMENITGIPRARVLRKKMGDMFGALFNEEISLKFSNHFNMDVTQFIKDNELSGEIFGGKVLNHDGSKKDIDVRHFPIKTNDKKIIACIAHDVTVQKRMEEELKVAKNNLELKVQKRTKELIRSNGELKKEIKDRKHVEKALIESRNYLDKIINSIADPVFVKDRKHRWMLLNDAFCKLIGYSREELLKKSDYNFLPAHEADILWGKDEEVFKTGIENVNEEEITDSNGNLHSLVTKKTLYVDNSGEKYIVAVIRDITPIKNVEKEKKREHHKLMDIIEFLPDATFVVDHESKIIAWNLAIEKMTGLSKDKVMGKEDYSYSIPFYGVKRPILIDLIFSPDKKIESFYDHVERDGNTLYTDVFIPEAMGSKGRFLWGKASPFYDDKGDFMGAIESIRDITDRKKMEEMLKESEEKYRKLFNNATDMITLAELKNSGELGHYIEVNDVTSQILGYTREELLKMAPRDLVAPENVSNMSKPTKKLFKEGNVTFEIVHVTKDGRRVPVEINSHLFKLKGKNLVLAIIRDITERKKAEKLIKESKDYYKTIFENTGAATFIVEGDTTISLVNAESEKISGYSKGEIEGTSWKKFVCGDYVIKMEEYHNLRRIDPGLAPRNYESTFADKYGNVRDILVTVAMIPGTEKSLASILDITDEKKAVNAMRKSETRLKLAMDMAKLVHWEYDVSSNLFTFDNQFYKLYGTTASKEGGFRMSPEEYARRFIPPEESHLVAEETGKALKTDDPDFSRSVEHSIIRADDEERFILVRYEIIKDEAGRTIKTYGVNQDITERKMAEKEIKKHVRKLDILNKVIVAANGSSDLQSLLKYIMDLVLEFMNFEVGAVYLIDPKEGVAKLKHSKDSNYSFDVIDNIKIKEYPFKQVYVEGMSLFVDQLDEVPPCVLRPINFKSLAVVPIYSKEKIIGSFNLLSIKKHHFTQKEKEIIKSIGQEIGSTISKFITKEKMKKLITELKRSNAELQQFAYITSHDLQEPLRTIASFTQLLERRYKGKFDDDADQFMEYIVEASIRMKQMILDLLEYSRLTRVEKRCKPLKIEDMIHNIFDNLNLLIQENNAEITCDAMPVVFADETQLFRVFQNLIENAIKFKKEGENPKIHISSHFDEENNEHVFSISDNGIGIEKQYFNRIFTIFQRLHTKEEYEGTGIGLAISKRIIESHGGNMWVESDYGAGSTFYFTLKSRP